MPKPGDGLIHGELQHVRDRATANLHIQDLTLEPAPATTLAGDEDVGQKDHLHLYRAGAFAGFAAAARHVEGKGRGRVFPPLRLRLLGIELADLVERLDVGHRIGTRCSPDG
jgi:hypothetical protein